MLILDLITLQIRDAGHVWAVEISEGFGQQHNSAEEYKW